MELTIHDHPVTIHEGVSGGKPFHTQDNHSQGLALKHRSEQGHWDYLLGVNCKGSNKHPYSI